METRESIVIHWSQTDKRLIAIATPHPPLSLYKIRFNSQGYCLNTAGSERERSFLCMRSITQLLLPSIRVTEISTYCKRDHVLVVLRFEI